MLEPRLSAALYPKDSEEKRLLDAMLPDEVQADG
jgi:hypothetical protein